MIYEQEQIQTQRAQSKNVVFFFLSCHIKYCLLIEVDDNDI